MPFGSPRCPSCGLSLQGPLAAQLFTTLSTADDLLVRLRTASAQPAVPVGAPVGATTSAPSGLRPGTPTPTPPGVRFPGPSGAPVPPVPTPPFRPERVRGASVPKILLALGALCLLVAALVFLAVAWSAMGVAGRTATLVGFTAVTAGLAAWAARRDLRAATESLGVVALGLLAFDLFGARDAGWLGDISTAGFFVVLGVVLAVSGAGAGLAARRTPAGALVGGEVVATLGLLVAAVGGSAGEWVAWSATLTLTVVLLGGATLAATRLRLTALTAGAALLTLATWVVLAIASWDRAVSHPSLTQLWADLEIWPLLASAALAGALALTRLPQVARLAGVSAATLVLAAGVLAPFADETLTAQAAAGAVLVLVVGALAGVVPQPWRRGLGVPIGFGLLWMVALAVGLTSIALERLGEAGTALWSGAAGASLPARTVTGSDPAGWLLPLAVAAVALGLLGLARSFPWADRSVGRLTDSDGLLGAALATGALTIALYAAPIWLELAVLLLAGAALTGRALRRGGPVPLALAAPFLGVGLLVSLHATGLTLAALVVVLLAAGAVHLRHPRLEVSVGAGALVAGALTAVVWTVGSLAAVHGEWRAVAAVLVLTALVLATPYVDQRLRVAGPATYARLGTEAGALVGAGVVSVAGVWSVAIADEPAWTAGYLTLVGAAASAMALLRPDRRLVGWLGGFLLAAASWVRLADIGVDAPEAYTLPSAAALLLVGLHHLRRAPRASTFVALGPGLALALLPSLVWVLAEPIALRAALLGLACLGLVVAGVLLHWAGPVLHGGVVGAVLVLRLATPLAEAVPRWALIGAAGALLVTMGITWERRVRDARAVAGYVRGLR